MPRKVTPRGAKVGSSEHVDETYFPPNGSKGREELERIARSKAGMPVTKYILSELFLGKIVRAKLVNIRNGKMYLTKRALSELRVA